MQKYLTKLPLQLIQKLHCHLTRERFNKEFLSRGPTLYFFILFVAVDAIKDAEPSRERIQSNFAQKRLK